MVEEIEVNVGWELTYGEKFAILFVALSELPVLVDGDDAAGCHCEIRLRFGDEDGKKVNNGFETLEGEG